MKGRNIRFLEIVADDDNAGNFGAKAVETSSKRFHRE